MITRIRRGSTPGTGKMAIWDKPESGSPLAPYNDPTAHWDKVKLHSDLQYLNDAISVDGIALTHQSVAGVTGVNYSGFNDQSDPKTDGQVLVQDQTLYTHDLGVVPIFNVRFNGQMLYSGSWVYYDQANQHVRFASAYATTSIIGIRTIGASSTTTLPAQNASYDLTIARDPAKIPGAPLAYLHTDPSEPIVFGHGRVTSDMAPLRRPAPGDTEVFEYPISQSISAWKGVLRAVTLDDGPRDFGAIHYQGNLIAARYINLAK